MPCCNSPRAFSTPRVTSTVLAPGNFSTTSMRPVPSFKIASPIRGWLSSTTVATSPSEIDVPKTGTLAKLSAEIVGEICRTPRRWFGVSMNPPDPGVDEFRKVRGEAQTDSPAVLTICSSVMPLLLRRAGSTCTCSCRLRSPHTDTLATPGTPTKRGTMFQRASTDMSMRETVFELRPTFMMRLAEESGCSRIGGLDTFGRACACTSRS